MEGNFLCTAVSGGSRGRAGWGCRRCGRGFGHALEACKNFLSTAVSGGSRGGAGAEGGGEGGGGGGLGTHWRPVGTFISSEWRQ